MRRGLHPQLGLAILRVVLGVTYLAHGAPKLIGGVGFTTQMLGELGFPAPLYWAWLITVLEFFGGLLLIVGFLVTPIALLLCVEMFLGIVLVHAAGGWYVIGPGHDGVEFNVVLIAALLTLVFAGPGIAAVDRLRGTEAVAEPKGVELPAEGPWDGPSAASQGAAPDRPSSG
ncbi:MAG: DoxX family protein [Gemmatimonadota bacterium]